ncbi:MAG TPA: ATP-grasp domain-containing protein [Methanothrix sp.]|nr:ATP-grasp domain-containing protein [Methanothrix sp.]HQA62218.1 ATP-grasp domain-containing protein [Methanothrix sp.]
MGVRADRPQRVLVVGQSVRSIALSAARSGHIVFAADCYSDLDLVESVSGSAHLDWDPAAPEDLAFKARAVIEAAIEADSVDCLVLGPGVEGMKVGGVRVLNNPPEKVAEASDKLWLARWLEAEGFATVPTVPIGEVRPGAFPLMVKPRRGAGGAENRLVYTDEELALLEGELIAQRFVRGTSASVSVIADGERAVAISANEQLIGTEWLGGAGYRYCGNITPLALPRAASAEMMRAAEEIASRLQLVGSNGVDFILADSGPVVLEVNPRFQGSLDAVEISTGLSLFQAHLLSFDGVLPKRPAPRRFGGRGVLYAEEDLRIDGDLRAATTSIADVPRPGSVARRGEPITSIISSARDRDGALALLRRRCSRIRRALRGL